MLMLIETPFQLFSTVLVFLAGGFIALNVAKKLDLNKIEVLALYVWHTVFCFAYVYYTLGNSSDSTVYHQLSQSGTMGIGVGTKFIVLVCYTASKIFGSSYLTISLIFNVIGAIGLLYLFAALKSVVEGCGEHYRKLVYMFVFLPSASFWSAGLGKEPVAMMSLGFLVWGCLSYRSRKLYVVLGVVTMFLVRPHIAGIMLIAIIFSQISSSNIKLGARVFVVLVGAGLAVILVPFAATKVGMEDVTNVEAVGEYLNGRQEQNLIGGGAIDISSMSFPVKIFTYLFRPLPHESHSVFALVSSFDNLLLLLLVVIGGAKVFYQHRGNINYSLMWAYFVGCTGILSYTTANLGISVRQKWMVIPVLLVLLFLGIARSKLLKNGHRIS